MIGAKTLIASSLALQATAFYIPPHIPKTDPQGGLSARSTIDVALANVTHVVELDCPGCPYASQEEGVRKWVQGVENGIYLEFSLSSEGKLLINDQLPFDRSKGPGHRLSAPQFQKSDYHLTNSIPLDFFLEQDAPKIEKTDESVLKHTSVKFTVLGLDGIPVHVNSVAVDILREDGTTVIAKITQIPFEETPGAITCDHAARWSMCRFRALVAAAIQHFRDTARKGMDKTSSWMKHGGCGHRRPGKAGKQGGRPHNKHHKGGHAHNKDHPHAHRLPHSASASAVFHAFHRYAHKVGHMFSLAIRFFFIPAILGIFGGILTSLIGMMFGQFIVYLWRRFVRGGQRGQVQSSRVEILKEVAEKDEKVALIDALEQEQDDFPPAYSDAAVQSISENEEKKQEQQ